MSASSNKTSYIDVLSYNFLGCIALEFYLRVSCSKSTCWSYELSENENPDITLGYSRGMIHWNKHQKADKVVGFEFDNYSRKNNPICQ